ncbi:MAG TPA: dihydrolipoamide acetyltransferase family protein [Trebonia sp.]|nr:dihydrolipoamide acetyltransferase family protein [Trebonia sp.]
MPSVLAGATEATIATWLVAPGDKVTVGQPLAEIETEKALVEYAAEEAGVIDRLLLSPGDTAEIGAPILVLVSDGETNANIDAALGAAPPPAPESNGHQAGAPPTRARVFASPIVRKLAVERGIDLTAIAGTGPNGRIVRRDLDRLAAPQRAEAAGEIADGVPKDSRQQSAPRPPHLESPPPTRVTEGDQAHAPAVPDNDFDLVKHTPMRRAIARRLTESKATVPHFYMVTECLVDELLALRARINETAPVKVSVNDFVLMAVAAAFGDVPEANVTWSDEGLVTHANVDLSIAVATDGGLVTPVLRGVQAMRLSGIARASADLARRARDRRLLQRELEGGVCTVSNLGMYGTLEFSAIINPPQSGILAVGAAKQQPVVCDGAVTIATVLRCTLSVDHRAIDGALAARWLAAFTARMEHPLATII